MPDDTPPRPHPRDVQGADELAAEAAKCETEARTLRYQAKLLEAQAAVLRRREALARTGSLPPVRHSNTLDTMNTSAISNVRRSKTAIDPAHRRHPFVAALVKQGLTVAKAALAIGRPRSTVQSWYKSPKDAAYREIPWECAEKIRELYGVPHSAWRSVGPKE